MLSEDVVLWDVRFRLFEQPESSPPSEGCQGSHKHCCAILNMRDSLGASCRSLSLRVKVPGFLGQRESSWIVYQCDNLPLPMFDDRDHGL